MNSSQRYARFTSEVRKKLMEWGFQKQFSPILSIIRHKLLTSLFIDFRHHFPPQVEENNLKFTLPKYTKDTLPTLSSYLRFKESLLVTLEAKIILLIIESTLQPLIYGNSNGYDTSKMIFVYQTLDTEQGLKILH